MIVVVTLSCAQCLLFLETFNLEMHHFAIWFVILICTPFQILFQWKKVMTITGRPRRWRTHQVLMSDVEERPEFSCTERYFVSHGRLCYAPCNKRLLLGPTPAILSRWERL